MSSLEILYEDKNILVINKPRGLLTHQDGVSLEENLEDKVLDYLTDKKEYSPTQTFKPGPCHRLDKDTSGIVVFGKNQKSLNSLNEIFQDHQKVTKKYIALVCGQLDENGEVNAPIRKNFQQKKMVVAPLKNGAKPAQTRYFIIKKFQYFTLVELELLTGRTHQIRVHMSYIRHHVVGDKKYGDFKANNYFKKEFDFENQFLHASSLTFNEICGYLSYLTNKTFSANISDEENKILTSLK